MYFTPIKLSEHRGKTPEGYLVIRDCVIARTGFQLYSDNEVDVPAGPDGIIRVERDPEEVFSPETIASAEGKDIVDNHPGEDVSPENWARLSRGHMQNVRRGTGIEDHLMLADLHFKHPDAIKAVEDNPTQDLSCGYGSQFEVYGPGRAAQRNIRINHVAFLRDIPGRCGPVCSTRDAAMQKPGPDLWGQPTHEKCSDKLCSCGKKTTTRTGDSGMAIHDWFNRVKDALTRDDKAALKQAVEDGEGIMKLTGNPGSADHEHHIHLHLGGPETTKPEGGLPETGETRVTSAKDDAGHAGGDHAATFGGRAFFTDAEANTAFHEKMKGMEDSIEHIKKTCEDGFEALKKHMDDSLAEHAKAAGTMVDSKIAGEESAHEKAAKEIEGELKEEAPPGTGDVTKARDSEMLVESFSQTVADAAVLSPGISTPVFDSKLTPAEGYAAICGLRKKALTAFAATEVGVKILSQITRTTDFAACACRDITPTFRAAVACRKTQLSTADMRGFKDGEKVQDKGMASAAPKTSNEWQAIIDEHYRQQVAAAAE